ncbi:MAG TPA: hypothetical protein VE545_08940 [Candidatus Dormibacteraeota bacterium]|nr:hypothetical protein [Candidatus Dormibacteraeota bacterium]
MKKSSKFILAAAILLVAALLLLAALRWRNSLRSGRDEILNALLEHAPDGTIGVVYVDVAELRRSPFAQKLFAWAPKPQADPDYARFIQETGFDYERDLDRVAYAAAKRGPQSTWFAIADGTFDRKKLAAYLAKVAKVQTRSGHDIYSFAPSVEAAPSTSPGSAPASPAAQLFLCFIANGRVAATNDPDLAALLAQKNSSGDFPPWQTHFTRLAGSPVFVVVRQDAATVNSIAAQTPGGLQSPELAALFAQLNWLTLAAQPQTDDLRIVAEGETSSDTVAHQLSDMLNGLLILAQTGLNDPKARAQINPQARTAYLDLLKSAEITRMDRQDAKAVRVVFNVTSELLNTATLPRAAAPLTNVPPPAPTPPAEKHPARKK